MIKKTLLYTVVNVCYRPLVFLLNETNVVLHLIRTERCVSEHSETHCPHLCGHTHWTQSSFRLNMTLMVIEMEWTQSGLQVKPVNSNCKYYNSVTPFVPSFKIIHR